MSLGYTGQKIMLEKRLKLRQRHQLKKPVFVPLMLSQIMFLCVCLRYTYYYYHRSKSGVNFAANEILHSQFRPLITT